MKSRKGFTLVELMVVVIIVAILSAIAIPVLRARIDNGKWTEAKAGMGTIVTSLRAYAAETKSTTTNLSDLGFIPSDLHGTYFTINDYSIVATNFALGADPELTYTIRCDKAGLHPGRWEYDETGTWTSSNP